LVNRGFVKETTLGILSEGRPQWVIGEFGVVKASCISVPMSIKLTPDEIAFRVNHSESKGFLISSNTIDEHDTVNICYTSGTTGNPKGIMLTHLNYKNSLRMMDS